MGCCRHLGPTVGDDVSMEPQPPSPTDEDSDELDPVAVALARALGAQLRVLPSDAARRAHVAGAAAAAGPSADADRAAADVLVDRAVRPSRRPGGRGPTRGIRTARRRAIPAAAMVLLVLVAGVSTWVGRSGPDLPIIALGGAGAATSMGAADVGMSREAAVASDVPMLDMMWIPVDYTFVLEDSARVPAGTGRAWRFAPPADLPASAARLAARFGMPTLVPSEWDATTLQSQTPEGASLGLMATGEWYFGAAPDEDMQWRCPEAPLDGAQDAPSGEGGISILPAYECEPPPPAVGVPSEAAARSMASALFAELGVTGIRFEDAYVDDWSINLWGMVPVEGAPRDVGQYVGIGFGGGGSILFANGTFARPVALGDYPTITSEDALDRLRAQMDFTAGGPIARPYPADLAPTDVPEERQQVTVRMITAELFTQFAWTQDGEMILVPHYRFRDADGGEWWVLAVAERYLAG
jgi:hypothetical protein